eukprot:CAMPEP_0182443048 /NCGR_PEP_ID=MMETSP1172-20130603/1887_1 /TAXON_ID=708627 /ORGANISM="Timspurckia oligopyrenoides, Strain CCMP3278" /LENGTH=524 /DNA_ID=CAMNT_0024638201 /DNA_START=48 /DNA_END=1622 /DNA_ORIENTATION=+
MKTHQLRTSSVSVIEKERTHYESSTSKVNYLRLKDDMDSEQQNLSSSVSPTVSSSNDESMLIGDTKTDGANTLKRPFVPEKFKFGNSASKRTRNTQFDRVVPSNEIVKSKGNKRHSIRGSVSAMRTTNPIRSVVDKLDLTQANPEFPVISLSLGDPTVHFKTHPIVTHALTEAVESYSANGYPPMIGLHKARNAVAEYHTRMGKNVTFEADDVIMTNGCSQAIQLSLSALADAGIHNVLIPNPGFSLYKSICTNLGVEAREYELDESNGWELDLESIQKSIDDNTVAIILTSPSNPTGAVHSIRSVTKLLEICEQNGIVLIADEIYYGHVFQSIEWKSVAEINSQLEHSAAVLCLGGLSKRFLVPGWCLGWILIHDPTNMLGEVRIALEKVSSLMVGPSGPTQDALPRILKEVPESWHLELISQLEQNAMFCYEQVKKNPVLSAIKPQGSMFMLIRIEFERLLDISDSVAFANGLFQEKSVVVLPGECFGSTYHFRISYTAPIHTLQEAFNRIHHFCLDHSRKY